MVSALLIVVDQGGLHARPAGAIVAQASIYQHSEIIIKSDDKVCNAKSFLSFLSMGLKYGNVFELIVIGGDEARITQEMVQVFKINHIANLK